MLNNQKENKEFLGKEEVGVDFVKEANVGEASAAPKAVQSAQISDINHVENAVVNGNGCCLEACIAMWVNRAIGRNLTALDVYNDMDEVAKKMIGDDATADDVNAAYMLQEYYHCGPCARYDALSPNRVLKQLQTRKPVIMYIKNSAGEKHAVIVKGISINEKSITYTIDDPNCGTGTITQSTAADTAKSTINSYTSTYTESDGSKKKFIYDTWYATISNTI